MSSLAQEYFAATNLNIVTFTRLLERKSSSQADIDRQLQICDRMLHVCQEHEGSLPRYFLDDRCEKVAQLLHAAKSEPEGVHGVLHRMILERKC